MTSRTARTRDRDHTRREWTPERHAKVKEAYRRSNSVNGWSEEEERAARAMWAGGVKAREIADALNARFNKRRTERAVIGRMHRIGARAGHDTTEWPAEEVAILLAAMQRGASGKEMSRLTGRSPAAVAGKLQRLRSAAAEERAAEATRATPCQPYNPARDPKPEWLRRNLHQQSKEARQL